MRSMKSLLLPASLCLCALAGGCKEEGFVTLFDEDGTWSLLAYDLEGSGALETIDSPNRKDQFLLRFVRTSGEEQKPEGIAAAATCKDVGGNQNLTESTCNDGFTCRCFKYSFNETTMIFTEFAADGASLYTPQEGEPMAGEPVTIFLEEVEDAASTFIFKPLPAQLFQSNAVNSRYEFRQKADSLFSKTSCTELCGQP
ncbi:MAG TPA: hypothetical protein ENJ18_04475 [Nannocystis exedens]|nr:hypothetical protein [Nannocystis exedens]